MLLRKIYLQKIWKFGAYKNISFEIKSLDNVTWQQEIQAYIFKAMITPKKWDKFFQSKLDKKVND